jgi:DNA-binding ferritin-like protein
MSDIIDFQSYKNKEKLEKVQKEIEASKLIDKIAESISQCKDGLVDIGEMLSYVNEAISAFPKEAGSLSRDPEDRFNYIEENRRQHFIDKFSSSTGVISKLAEVNMKNLLSYARALSQMYQHMHWRASGQNYYGDHLLYERLYDGVQDEIDIIAEKIIGIEDDSNAVGPASDADLTASLVKKFTSDGDSPDEFPQQAINAEKGFLELISSLVEKGISDGIDDMLQSIANKHEEHLYLLQQRARKANISHKLSKIANKLDQKGYYDLANKIDEVLKGAK